MLTQREYDIAQMESEVEIQELLLEWYRDYLGSRGTNNALPSAGNAGTEAPDNTQASGTNQA